MIYLKLFWITIILFLVLHYSGRRIKLINRFMENYNLLILMLAGSFLLMALATEGPINIAGVEIPIQLQ